MSKIYIFLFSFLFSATFGINYAGDFREADSTGKIFSSNNNGIIEYDSLPFVVGNKWFYQVYSHGHDEGISVAEIVKDTVFDDGKTYYKFNFTSFLPGGSREYLRYDSGQIYFLNYWDSTVTPVLKFTATAGESWQVNFSPYFTVFFGNTDTLTVFNKLTRFFEFSLDGLQIATVLVSPDFGFLRIEDYGDTGSIIPSMSYVLKCCVLSDTIYGNVTAVEKPMNILNNFALLQNYPNPFNAETNIKYSLPYYSSYKITLYDPLGRSIKVLSEGFADAGVYNFRMTDVGLSSGTYFVEMRTDAGTKYIKMTLLK